MLYQLSYFPIRGNGRKYIIFTASCARGKIQEIVRTLQFVIEAAFVVL